LAFAPALVAAARLPIAPAWYLAAFVILTLLYWTSFRTQVPLFLSNRATAETLTTLIPEGGQQKIADLGCATGSLLLRLARARPECRFIGIETAPLPFAIARLTRRSPNLELRWGDFWAETLEEYDLVYVFLSPVPMARLWQKVRAEMRAGAMLVSNSFPVPEVAPDRVVDVPDRRHTRLFCYRI
jgi:SAM-dependent methyltransferase